MAATPRHTTAEHVPEPADDPRRTATTPLRSSADWKAAIRRLATFDRAPTVSDLIDRAVAAYAKSIGFAERLPGRRRPKGDAT
jgi:hypothetical protein